VSRIGVRRPGVGCVGVRLSSVVRVRMRFTCTVSPAVSAAGKVAVISGITAAAVIPAAAACRVSTATAGGMCCCGVGCAGMRGRCVSRIGVRRPGVGCVGMRLSSMVRVRMGFTCTVSSAVSAAGKVAVISGITAAAVIPAAAAVFKAMTAPAVAVSPASPWAHAEEDAVVEVTGAIKAGG